MVFWGFFFFFFFLIQLTICCDFDYLFLVYLMYQFSFTQKPKHIRKNTSSEWQRRQVKLTKAPGGVAQRCGISCASSWSLVRVVAGTMWGGGGNFMACIAPTLWLSWGARVRSVTFLSQQLWLNPTFPSGGAPIRSRPESKSHMVAPAPPFIQPKKKKSEIDKV